MPLRWQSWSALHVLRFSLDEQLEMLLLLQDPEED
jgi:hypothetical protein